MVQLAAAWGLIYEADVFVDSSAAVGVAGRKSAGKLRHVRVGQLWVQERAESGSCGTGRFLEQITLRVCH